MSSTFVSYTEKAVSYWNILFFETLVLKDHKVFSTLSLARLVFASRPLLWPCIHCRVGTNQMNVDVRIGLAQAERGAKNSSVKHKRIILKLCSACKSRRFYIYSLGWISVTRGGTPSVTVSCKCLPEPRRDVEANHATFDDVLVAQLGSASASFMWRVMEFTVKDTLSRRPSHTTDVAQPTLSHLSDEVMWASDMKDAGVRDVASSRDTSGGVEASEAKSVEPVFLAAVCAPRLAAV